MLFAIDILVDIPIFNKKVLRLIKYFWEYLFFRTYNTNRLTDLYISIFRLKLI